MSSRHTRRVFRGRAFKSKPDHADPNRPGSPEYTQRHRQFFFEHQPGMRRVDIGAPVHSIGREVRQVSQGKPKGAEAPASVPPAPAPSAPVPEPVERDWRKEYGLGSDV